MAARPRSAPLPETVIIVGASGFIGRNLVRHLKGRVDRIVPVGRIPLGVAVHPDGTTVYVTNVLDEGFVSVVDTLAYAVIDTIRFPAPIQPQASRWTRAATICMP